MSKTVDYFYKNITRRVIKEEIGECWIWNLSCDGSGRPAYCDRSLASHNQLASRGLWKLLRNPTLTDPKVFLCHTCDEPKCINPDHLYEGDAKSNKNDAVNRNRIGLRKLKGKTDEIVRLFKEGVEQQDIAKRIGVDRQTIQRFLNGHIECCPFNYVKEAEDIRNALIVKMYEEGKSLTQISIEAKVSDAVIYSVVPEIRTRPKGAESQESKELKATMTISERNVMIRKKKQEGVSVRELAAEFHVSIPLIYNVCNTK